MTNHYQNREYNKSDEDENYSWRDVREEMSLSRYMEMEDEDYLELVTDGNGNEEEIEGEDQADWAMKWISEDLTNYFEESGDIWVMIYQSDSLEPIMHVDEENIYISPDYDPDNDSSIEIDGEEFELSPVPILQETGYALELLDKDYVVQEIPDRPELEHEDNLDKISDNFLQGKFAAPGLEEKYYERAEEAIERFINRNRSEESEDAEE